MKNHVYHIWEQDSQTSECIKTKGLILWVKLGAYECLWLLAMTQDSQCKDVLQLERGEKDVLSTLRKDGLDVGATSTIDDQETHDQTTCDLF